MADPDSPPILPDPPGPSRSATQVPQPSGASESLRVIGGLVALGTGLLALALIAVGAFIVNTDDAVKVATAAFGVIGTLVGAYFGQKIGSDGTKEAIGRANQEATKAQVYAAHLPHSEATKVVALAHLAATGRELPPDGAPGSTP